MPKIATASDHAWSLMGKMLRDRNAKVYYVAGPKPGVLAPVQCCLKLISRSSS